MTTYQSKIWHALARCSPNISPSGEIMMTGTWISDARNTGVDNAIYCMALIFD
ncbi:hypothetical protein QM637_06715 [Pantoea allii]|uniref:hypothetical protein n=1 Tax=Pantoea allii TaxID=574096 RepID=UPI0024B76BF0|nr:hypothetical protein [Pantoea allii]MDJ0035523.1 hypothetical protein [Pantoea allii]